MTKIERLIYPNTGLILIYIYVLIEKNKINNSLIVCHRLEIWPGFVTMLNEFENGLYICCDISHRILCVETVLQKM